MVLSQGVVATRCPLSPLPLAGRGRGWGCPGSDVAFVAPPHPRGFRRAALPVKGRAGKVGFVKPQTAAANALPALTRHPVRGAALAVHRRHGILRIGRRARGKIPALRRIIACCGASGMTGGGAVARCRCDEVPPLSPPPCGEGSGVGVSGFGRCSPGSTPPARLSPRRPPRQGEGVSPPDAPQPSPLPLESENRRNLICFD